MMLAIGLLARPTVSSANHAPVDDVALLADEILRIHPHRDQPDFEERIRQAEANNSRPVSSRDALVVKLAKLAAAARDNGTYVHLFQPSLGYTIAPIFVYDFDDGLVVIDADERYRGLIGAKVLGIGGRPMSEVRAAVMSTVPASSPGRARYQLTRHMLVPELLHALGVSSDRDRFSLRLQLTDGTRRTVALAGTDSGRWTSFYGRSLRRVSETYEQQNYWFKLLPDQKAIIAEIRFIRDGRETLADFGARLKQAAVEHPDFRLILDLRYGGGGSGHAMGPLVQALTSVPQSRRSGRMYALIGRLTSGTVLELASVLRNVNPVVFVGEAAGAGPNGVGDSRTIRLPQSNIEATITEVEWSTTLEEKPAVPLAPNIPVSVLSEDHLAGRDRAFQTALTASVAADGPGHTVASPLANADWTGLYSIGDGRTVSVFSTDSGLWMTLEDPRQRLGLNFVTARSPLFEGAPGTMHTWLDDVTLVRTNKRLVLRWRGVDRTMTPTVWNFDRVLLGVIAVLLVLVAAFILGRVRRVQRPRRQVPRAIHQT
ncbi:MAG: hypothetical protein AAF449_15950 [Myxococcota bacterium]